MSLFLIAPPTAEPITVQEAKDFCRVTHDAENGLFQSLITAACRHLERDLNISIGEQQWKLTLPWLPDRIDLPRGPVTNIDTFGYADDADVLQAINPDLFTVELGGERQQIVLKTGSAWPSIPTANEAVTIIYTAGLEDIETGKDLWLALQFLIQHFYVRGAAEEPPTIVRTLSQPFRRYA